MYCDLEQQYILRQSDNGLTLVCGDLSLCQDFMKMKKRILRHNLMGEKLIQACSLNKSQINKTGAGSTKSDASITIIDATAGLGEDSFLMAAAGAQVHLYEHDEVTAALLEDALKRAENASDELVAEAARRMHFHIGDSITAMNVLDFTPDIVYLDPMFPERTKSGLVKKKAQILQMLEHPCGNEKELFEAAVRTGAQRIVVKRPKKGPYLDDRKPAYSIEGSVVRFDCYLFH